MKPYIRVRIQFPPREALADSRTLQGSGAAGVEIARDVLTETRSAVEPLVPLLDTPRWILVAVALAGVAVTIYARLDDWKRGRR